MYITPTQLRLPRMSRIYFDDMQKILTINNLFGVAIMKGQPKYPLSCYVEIELWQWARVIVTDENTVTIVVVGVTGPLRDHFHFASALVQLIVAPFSFIHTAK